MSKEKKCTSEMQNFENLSRSLFQEELTPERFDRFIEIFESINSESEKNDLIKVAKKYISYSLFVEFSKRHLYERDAEAMAIYFEHASNEAIVKSLESCKERKKEMYYPYDYEYYVSGLFVKKAEALANSGRFFDVIPFFSKKRSKKLPSIYRDVLVSKYIKINGIDETFVDLILDSDFFSVDQHIIVLEHLFDQDNKLYEKFLFSESKSVQGVLARRLPKKKAVLMIGSEGKLAKKALKKRFDK